MKQQRSTAKKRNQPEKRQNGDAVGRPSWRSSFLRDPGAKFLGGKLNKQKNSLNFASTCLKVWSSLAQEIRFLDMCLFFVDDDLRLSEGIPCRISISHTQIRQRASSPLARILLCQLAKGGGLPD